MDSLVLKVNLIVLIVLTGLLSVNGQKGVEDGSKYGHGEDSIRCVRDYSIYREYSRQRDYKTAYTHWKIPFDECPLINKNIYLDGVKIFRSRIEAATTPELGKNGLDTLMLIYDRRIQYFGERGNVKGRQGVDLLRFGRDNLEYIKQAYGYLKESIELRKLKTSDAVLGSYFSTSIVLFQNNELDANTVIEDFILVSENIDGQLEKKPNDKGLKDLKISINDNFVNEGPGECETLVAYFEDKIMSKKEDIDFLRMLTSLLRNRDCTNSELFYNASKDLHQLVPTAESALNLAIMDFKKGEFKGSSDFYQQAINLETDEDKKADYYFGMAACNNEMKNKQKARELALKAASVRAGWGEPYILIGQLYADSKSECSSISLPNAVYWIAVDMFVKAKTLDSSVEEKANKLILAYSKYFPNEEEAFFQNVTEGNTYSIGCWINETTKARFNN
jgi:tetratricopeptide (TPR) repeat protein